MAHKQMIPVHRISLPGGSWQLWRDFALRGAGFAAEDVLALAAPDSSQAATNLIAAEMTFEAARKTLLSLLHEQRSIAVVGERPLIRRQIKLVSKRRTLDNDICGVVGQAYRAALDALKAANEVYTQTISNECQTMNLALRHAFSESARQAAIIWQNRALFMRTIPKLLSLPADAPRNTKMRQREQLLARYLQRYCLKNDSIGFFGPVGWGQLNNNVAAITYAPGTGLIKQRTIYFEQWGFAKLAAAIAVDKRLRPAWSPRRLPQCYVAGATLHLPLVADFLRRGLLPPLVQASLPLTSLQCRIWQLCDGQTPAQLIARELLADAELAVESQTAVYKAITSLCDLGALRWTLDLPLTAHPELDLRRQLNQIRDVELRDQALSKLDAVEAGRTAVAQTGDDPQVLHDALQALEHTFARLSKSAATRHAGKSYGGRTIIYEDCRRDMQLSIGADFLQKAGPTLSMILDSTRWYTYQIACLLRPILKEMATELMLASGLSQVDMPTFSNRLQPFLADADCAPIADTTRELQARWQRLLAVSAGARRVQLCSADLATAVTQTFTAPHAGWSLARYRAPDIMIAAQSVAAIERGDYQLVLGELHLFNTLGRAMFSNTYPQPAALQQARALDIPQGGVVPVPSVHRNTGRLAVSLTAPQDVWLAYDDSPATLQQQPLLSLGDLVVEVAGDSLCVRSRDGEYTWDIIEFLGYTLSNRCMTFPDLLATAVYSPRITIDDVVVQRETWHFSAAKLDFAHQTGEADLFLAARRWQQENQLPRFIFIKLPTEPKPLYVDFDSPLYVTMLAKSLRRAASDPDATLTVTEMLPAFDQLWLTDVDGRCYTSELRLVALDPQETEPCRAIL